MMPTEFTLSNNLLDPHFLSLNEYLFLITLALTTLVFLIITIDICLASHNKPIVAGMESFIGSQGVVLRVGTDKILVRILGEIWEAHSSHQLHEHQKIVVTAVDGLSLTVAPLNAHRTIKEGD